MKSLLGWHGLVTNKRRSPGKATVVYAAQRPQHWRDIRLRGREPVRREAAERAEVRYGLLLLEMMRLPEEAEEKRSPLR